MTAFVCFTPRLQEAHALATAAREPSFSSWRGLAFYLCLKLPRLRTAELMRARQHLSKNDKDQLFQIRAMQPDGFSDFIHESARSAANKRDSKLKNAGLELAQNYCHVEVFHIMLPGEYWLSKAMLFPPDFFKWIDRICALKHNSLCETAFDRAGICRWSCTRRMPRLT
eukprot:s4372_g1.t1